MTRQPGSPGKGPAWVTDLEVGDRFLCSSSTAAIAGYPGVAVPAGFVAGLPVGISFFGRASAEPTLLRPGYGFEQGVRARKPPGFRPRADVRPRPGELIRS